ncbi:MAG: hypothetical protein S4CHLAM7_13320 [Chlamydiae bacterium]|nr:hypothetical protein [Chlamydiota bacterium]
MFNISACNQTNQSFLVDPKQVSLYSALGGFGANYFLMARYNVEFQLRDIVSTTLICSSLGAIGGYFSARAFNVIANTSSFLSCAVQQVYSQVFPASD